MDVPADFVRSKISRGAFAKKAPEGAHVCFEISRKS
jgi:hypothetical protein